MPRYKQLAGSNGKRTKNSKALECAARYLVEQDRWMTADEIYHNMKYRNGNLYRNTRHTLHYTSFAAKMVRMPGVQKRNLGKHRVKTEYRLDEDTYHDLFPIDPMMRMKNGTTRKRTKWMRWANENKA
tara:strand:+ start:373 stop:756 length:384 start_codon:yes stop_codon:yes gene_type:complete